MSITTYENWQDVPVEIAKRLEFDVSTCELNVACERSDPPTIGGYLARHPETDEDVPAYRPVTVLHDASGSEPDFVLCCSDCADWFRAVAKGSP